MIRQRLPLKLARYFLKLYFIAFVAFGLMAPKVSANDTLVPLAQIGPWPAISGLIGYQGRVWFVNSVKFEDHNSADVYSLDPVTGWLRYERHLFSQDAGRPAISGGLLYWPFEDGRSSMGQGEFMMTNGRDWRWQVIRGPQAFHVHAMHQHGQSLFAATGAFHGVLHRSDDRGESWKAIYQSRDTDKSFGRLLSLASMGSDLYAGLYASNQKSIKLMRLEGGTLKPVQSWPVGDVADGLVVFKAKIYGLHTSDNVQSVWRTDGQRSAMVAGLKDVSVKVLCAGKEALWAISVDGRGGALWKSADGVAWREVQRFGDDQPVDLTVINDRPYVGMIGGTGRGVLWGPKLAMPVEIRLPQSGKRFAPLPVRKPAVGNLAKLLKGLDDVLSSQSALKQRGDLRDAIIPIAALSLPEAGDGLASRLDQVLRGPVRARFAGGSARLDQKANWNLLWAMGHIGHGRVPLHLLSEPWQVKPHRGQKYAASPPMAAWVMGLNKQDDAASIKALIDRLGFKDDPLWLRGDIVGALTAITGQRFGYERDNWLTWYKLSMSKKRKRTR